MRRVQILGIGIVLCAVPGSAVMAQTSLTSAPALGVQASVAGAQTPAAAPALIAEAVKAARASHKTVFVHFGASWCGYCHVLDTLLHSKEVGPIFDAHYVLVPLTVQDKAGNNPGGDSVMAAMGLKGGLPVYAFLDGEGKQIASSMAMPDGSDIGYPVFPQEITAFDDLVKKTAPNISDADLAKIDKYLNDFVQKRKAHAQQTSSHH